MIYFLINIAAYLLFTLLGSLIMCGWYKATREKMIFEFWSRYWEVKDTTVNLYHEKVETYRHGKWAHVMSGCVYCYASIYGSLIYWIIGAALVAEYHFIVIWWQVLVLWIGYMLATCALNGIIIKKVL